MTKLTILLLNFLVIINKSQGFVINPSNQISKNIPNNQLYRTRNLVLALNTKKTDDEQESNKFDIIEGIGGFMGYPKERKWKGFRIACYSIFAGSILRSAVVDLGTYIDNKTNKDSLEQFSNVAVVLQENPSKKDKENQPVEFQKIKILDEPYLCENVKFI